SRRTKTVARSPHAAYARPAVPIATSRTRPPGQSTSGTGWSPNEPGITSFRPCASESRTSEPDAARERTGAGETARSAAASPASIPSSSVATRRRLTASRREPPRQGETREREEQREEGERARREDGDRRAPGG